MFENKVWLHETVVQKQRNGTIVSFQTFQIALLNSFQQNPYLSVGLLDGPKH